MEHSRALAVMKTRARGDLFEHYSGSAPPCTRHPRSGACLCHTDRRCGAERRRAARLRARKTRLFEPRVDLDQREARRAGKPTCRATRKREPLRSRSPSPPCGEARSWRLARARTRARYHCITHCRSLTTDASLRLTTTNDEDGHRRSDALHCFQNEGVLSALSTPVEPKLYLRTTLNAGGQRTAGPCGVVVVCGEYVALTLWVKRRNALSCGEWH
jgi:hypothetical protein